MGRDDVHWWNVGEKDNDNKKCRGLNELGRKRSYRYKVFHFTGWLVKGYYTIGSTWGKVVVLRKGRDSTIRKHAKWRIKCQPGGFRLDSDGEIWHR